MSTVGIICEYNPFHNGHLFQLNKAKEITGADTSIAVMSGNFIQRGIPAIFDKYTRADIAVKSGVDIVFELPFVYATSSAREFATGAVTLINKLGTVDYIAFGAETENVDLLSKIADLTNDEPEQISLSIKKYIAAGMTFPSARNIAIKEYLKSDETDNILNGPNNILAIEYIAALKRLNSDINPIIIKRTNNDYLSTEINSDICSATAIRNILQNNPENVFELLKKVVPKPCYNDILNIIKTNIPIYENDLSEALYFSYYYDGGEKYSDMDEELYNRFSKLDVYSNYKDAAESLKSKNVTLTHVYRALLHFIFKLKESDLTNFKSNGYVSYAKLLSIRKSKTHTLREIKSKGEINIITKTADDYKKLNPLETTMFNYDLRATDLYNKLYFNKNKIVLPNDFKRSVNLLE